MINLSSDTATEPSEEMRSFAESIETGNGAHEGCDAVNELQKYAAQIFGAKAALFTFGGTKSNLIAARLHAPYGSKIFCASGSHVDTFAESAYATEPIRIRAIATNQGAITKQDLQDTIDTQLDKDYAAPAAAIILENTMGYRGGDIYTYKDLEQVSALARENEIKVHIDGARIFNASVSEGRNLTEYMKHADTLSFCLSKALGASQGSVLLGTQEAIDEAKTVQRRLGDNVYGVGRLAAEGLFALRNNIEKLKEDHHKATQFQACLQEGAEKAGVHFMHDRPPTNMVLFNVASLAKLSSTRKSKEFTERLKSQDVELYSLPQGWVRAVAHRSVSSEKTEEAADITLQMIKDLG